MEVGNADVQRRVHVSEPDDPNVSNKERSNISLRRSFERMKWKLRNELDAEFTDIIYNT